jgi:hypothetical protein
MNEFFKKISSIARDIDTEVGGVVLFGVFKPSETPQRWDVIVSADWVTESTAPAIFYVAGKLQGRLDEEELVSISRIVALPPSSDFVRSVLDRIRVSDEGTELQYCVFNGIPMNEAFIAIANPDSHSHAPLPASATQRGARASIKKATQKTRRRPGTSATSGQR